MKEEKSKIVDISRSTNTETTTTATIPLIDTGTVTRKTIAFIFPDNLPGSTEELREVLLEIYNKNLAKFEEQKSMAEIENDSSLGSSYVALAATDPELPQARVIDYDEPKMLTDHLGELI